MKKFINSPFYSTPSPEILKLDKEYMKLCFEFEKLTSLPLFWEKGNRKFIRSCKGLLERVNQTNPENEFEKILLMNLNERIISHQAYAERMLNPNMKFHKFLETEERIKDKDIQAIKKYAESIELDKVLEKLAEFPYRFYTPSTEEEIKNAFEFCKEFLELTFSGDWPFGYEEYLKSVEFARGTGSYHATGRIVLGSSSMKYINFYSFEEAKLKEFLDLVKIAGMIGEEGLLGHQGHNLFTKKSTNLYMLTYTGWFEHVIAEAVATFGSHQAIKLLDQNRGKFSSFCPTKLVENLMEFHNLRKDIHFLSMFVSNYGHILFSKGEFDRIFPYLSDLTKNPSYESEPTRKDITHYYESGRFYKEWRAIKKEFIRLAGIENARKIRNLLSKLKEDEASKVIKWMKLGYWAPDPFEKYLRFLIKNCSRLD